MPEGGEVTLSSLSENAFDPSDIKSVRMIGVDGTLDWKMTPGERTDMLNIGGFSDAVFNVVTSFLEGDASRFAREVESVEL